MSTILEKQLLWGELGLDSLLVGRQDVSSPGQLNSRLSAPPQFTTIQEQELRKRELAPLSAVIEDREDAKNGMKSVMSKHKKMLDKPTYAAIMGRYNSLPHKPKVISKSKLSELSDPVLGRLSQTERRELELRRQKQQQEEQQCYHYSPMRQSIPEKAADGLNELQQMYADILQQQQQKLQHGQHPYERAAQLAHAMGQALHDKQQRSPVRDKKISFRDDRPEDEPSSGLFLTETAVSGSSDPQHPSLSPVYRDADQLAGFLDRFRSSPTKPHIEMNIKASKNGLSSMMRDRLQFAQKVDRIASEHVPISENDVLAAYQRYADIKQQREKQVEESRKAAALRGRPPRMAPRMTKKSNEAMNRQRERSIERTDRRKGDGRDRSRSRSRGRSQDPTIKKSNVRSSGYGVSKTSGVDSRRKLRQQPSAGKQKQTQRLDSSMSLSDDDQFDSNVFLTGMISDHAQESRNRSVTKSQGIGNANNIRNRRSKGQQDSNNTSASSSVSAKSKDPSSKLKNRLHATIARSQLPDIASAKPVNSGDSSPSRLLSSKSARGLATKREELDKERLNNSSSAPSIRKGPSRSTRTSAPQPQPDAQPQRQAKSTSRLQPLSQVSQPKKTRALNPEERFQQMKAALLLQSEEDDVGDAMNGLDGLNGPSHYGKKRTAVTSGQSIPNLKSGAGSLTIARMPRDTTGNSPQRDRENILQSHVDFAIRHDPGQSISSEMLIADALPVKENNDIIRNSDLQSASDANVASANTQETDGDIQSLISRLKKYETSMQPKGTSDLYVKPDANATLVKHAERLGSHFTNIDAIMDRINSIRDGLE